MLEVELPKDSSTGTVSMLRRTGPAAPSDPFKSSFELQVLRGTGWKEALSGSNVSCPKTRELLLLVILAIETARSRIKCVDPS